jgi:hypothetical protein
VGWLADTTGTASTGLYVVAGLEAVAAGLILFVLPRPENHAVYGAHPLPASATTE